MIFIQFAYLSEHPVRSRSPEKLTAFSDLGLFDLGKGHRPAVDRCDKSYARQPLIYILHLRFKSPCLLSALNVQLKPKNLSLVVPYHPRVAAECIDQLEQRSVASAEKRRLV